VAGGVSSRFVPKSLPLKCQETTLLGGGRDHLSLMSGDRRNAPGRVNEMPAEGVLLSRGGGTVGSIAARLLQPDYIA
jgi:hypothetical protein